MDSRCLAQAAEALGIWRAGADRHWTDARAWLRCQVEGDNRPPRK
jgi:hypothetical protein